ncbi:type II toxin-antitoxin system Phd/YefM family antitoxin [bacterium]|nr:type II toxin-antitoxin system Phd/YefM family antitoxin [bacterium]
MIDGRRIKPISYLKSHAAEVLKDLKETGKPYVITQHGEGAAVLMDINEFEKQKEAITLLRILYLSDQEVARGEVEDLDSAFADIRSKLAGEEQ